MPTINCVAFSGRLGSGKDSVGEQVANQIFPQGYKKVAFADQVRNEVNTFLRVLKNSNGQALWLAFASQNIPSELQPELKEKLAAAYQSVQPDGDAYTRTSEMRDLLQFYGTNVRRAQNNNYWVDLGIKEIQTVISNGIGVYVTDARFPNEIHALHNIGAVTVRLEVSDEQQEARVILRDGIFNPEARVHESETALDNFTEFTHIIDTNTLSEAEVVNTAATTLTADFRKENQ